MAYIYYCKHNHGFISPSAGPPPGLPQQRCNPHQNLGAIHSHRYLPFHPDSITPAVTNVTDSKPLNYPFALPRNMSTSFYRYALSISGLQQNFPVSSSTGRYSVMLEVLNMSPSNMAIAIKTSLST